MFKRIVVGYDGSDRARKALDIATQLATLHNSSIVLAHALSTAPLTDAERALAETEFGLKYPEVPPPAAAIVEAAADPRLAFVSVPDPPSPRLVLIRTELARFRLNEARESVLQRGVENVEISIETGDPADVILDVAKTQKADLITIGSRGFSDLQGLVFGSTSHKVAHRAPCTCLTVT